jgi:hypothetical protein
MKKIIYSALLILATAMTITACTEEEVKPSAETSNGGGSGSTGPIKP